MKTHLRLALLTILGSALAASPALAAPPAQPAHAHPVGTAERNSSASVVRGAGVIEVYSTLGEPAEKLGNDQWIYRGFHAGSEQAPEDDCDILVITFVKGRVADMQLVNQPAVAIFAQRFEAKKNPNLYAVASK